MKIMYVNLLKKKKKDEEPLMKDLREKNIVDFLDDIKHKNTRNIHNIQENKFFKNLKNFSNKNIVKKNELTLFVLSLMLVTSAYMNYTNKMKKAKIGNGDLTAFVSAKTSNDKDTANKIEETNDLNLSEQTDTNKTGNASAEENSNNTNSNTGKNTQIANSNENNLEKETIETGTKTSEKQSNTTEANKNNASNSSDTRTSDDNKEANKNVNSDDYFSLIRIERDKSYSQMLETYTNILKDSNVPNDQKTIASNEIKKINDRTNQITTIENLLKGKGIEDAVIMINDNSIDAIIKSNNELEKNTVAQIENVVSRELNADINTIHISTHN